MRKVCVIGDNEYLYLAIREIIQKQNLGGKYEFTFFVSESKTQTDNRSEWGKLDAINLNKVSSRFLEQYDLYISLHCRQIFPEKMVRKFRCINVHPGYNPYNRGWYPQVFSIMNKKPVGVTIHEMDSKLDHGAIIYREEVKIEANDTSWSVYQKIQQKERELLEQHLIELLEGNYQKYIPETEGNINYKKDFEGLCQIDLDRKATYGEVIDFLRAMSFNDYKNAYFLDKNGDRIYVKVEMRKR